MIDSGHVAYNEAGFRNFGSFIPPVSIHRRIFFDPVAAAENVSATAKMTPKRIAHLLAFPTIAGLARFGLPLLDLLGHDSVAFARRAFKSNSAFYFYRSALVSYEPGLLQDTCSHCNAGPACSQHVGQKLLCQRHEGIATQTVLGHKEPPRQPPVNLMQSIAGGHLRGL